MNTMADYLNLTIIDDNGTETLRFTDARAVIPIDEARQPGHRGQVTVRIEAQDVLVDRNEMPYDTSYLWEADLPGVYVDDQPGEIQSAALEALYREGVYLADICWTWNDGQYTSIIEVAA